MNVDKIKLGGNTPSFYRNSIHVDDKHLVWSWYKRHGDSGGYYVRGLWLALHQAESLYWWPWDLNVPGGALKDENFGAARWGYTVDSNNKNITNKMTENFPQMWEGTDWGVAISFWSGEANYEENGVQYLDFGDNPIVVKFLDDRFDGLTWSLGSGALGTISEDGRTFTINRVKFGNFVAFTARFTDGTLATARTKMKNVYADVKGLTAHRYNICDLSSIESWKVYSKGTLVYDKEKTVENCWIRHGLATIEDTGKIRVTDAKAKADYADMSVYLPPVIDLVESIQNLYFNISFINTEYWDEIKAAIAATPVTDYEFLPNVFKGSNVSGSVELTLNLENGEHLSWGTNYKWNHWGNATEVTLKVAEGSTNRITAPQHLFYDSKKLVTINTPKNIMSGRDTSGMFEGCAALVNIPNNLILWSDRAWDNSTETSINNVCYMCINCASLVVFPAYDTQDRYSNNNTIKSSGHIRQAFQGCSKLQSIGPVIDLEYVDPQTSDQNAWIFLGTPKLTDVRLKNLNHGTWHFDDSGPSNKDGDLYGYQGNIPLLDEESVVYLFDNLMDLTTHDETSTEPGNPNRSSARIYCPLQWEDKITSDMIIVANTKGWTIYIGGVLTTV